MAKIHLLIDHSSSTAWLAATMRANQDLLAANGIALAPLTSQESATLTPWNNAFWDASASEPLKPALAEKLSAVQACLDKGRDILFLGQTADRKLQKNFFAFLKKHLHPERHTVHPIVVMGKPGLLLEYWWQDTVQGVDASLARKYIEYAENLFQLPLAAQEEWGEVTLIPNQHDAITAAGVAETAAKVFRVLGIREAPNIAGPLPFYYFTNSATALRLLQARQVRHNDWPHLDDAAYMSALQKADASWAPEPLSPLAQRRVLLEKGRAGQEKLEMLLGLPAHALDAPDWYGTLPEMAAQTPLKPERLRAFAESLTPDTREVLLARFANDRAFLSRDQEALALALAAAEGKDFRVIEEAQGQPTLTVLTMTRNHEKYIAQCIEGVLAQKTDFPVRHLILDHYSTDSTPHIINRYAREYPSIRPVLLNNYHQLYNNVHDLFIRCQSEYAALCDGDDYFIDPLKLQKQMDFLKSHPSCALCFHPVRVVFEDGRPSAVFPPREALPRGEREEYCLADLFRGNMIQTNSVVYKWRFKDGLPAWFRDDLCPGDWYWHLLHAERGGIGFLPDIMSVYRRHGNSLYKYSFIDNLKHRREFGMAELKTYYLINKHFKNRYFSELAKLANGVLCDFLAIFIETGDSSLLDSACESYPEFGKYFLDNITLEKQRQVAQETSQ